MILPSRSGISASDVRERFIGLGISARASTPEELQCIYDADVVRWRQLIADATISRQ
jgi:hypothetical protein